MSGDLQESMDDSDRLKPCPFCSGSASAGFVAGDGDNAGGHYISCDQCDASTGLRFSCGEDARPILAEQWNKRTASDMRKALRELLEIEEARIETGAFTPNAEAQRRIDAARKALEA